MQDPSILLPEEGSVIPNSRKKKPSTHKASMFLQGLNVKEFQELLLRLPTRTGKKASKRGLKNEVSSPLFQQPESLPSDSLLDSSSASGNEYQALRRKYLMLEEESFGLGGELTEDEDQVKTLEVEKLELLNELVVLEGLFDPS